MAVIPLSSSWLVLAGGAVVPLRPLGARPLTCEACGGAFARPANGAKRKFCGAACYGRHMQKVSLEKRWAGRRR